MCVSMKITDFIKEKEVGLQTTNNRATHTLPLPHAIRRNTGNRSKKASASTVLGNPCAIPLRGALS